VLASVTTSPLPVSPGKTRFKSIESQREKKKLSSLPLLHNPFTGTTLTSSFLQHWKCHIYWVELVSGTWQFLLLFSKHTPSLSFFFPYFFFFFLAICSLSRSRKFDFQLLNTAPLSCNPIYLRCSHLIILLLRLNRIVSSIPLFLHLSE
jgi:hypothetical protein